MIQQSFSIKSGMISSQFEGGDEVETIQETVTEE